MKQILLIIFVFAVFASSILAQPTTCNLQLEVYKFQADSETEPVQINKATAFLQKEKSKTKVKADLQNELPYFANLAAGKYNSTILMSGYKTTTKEIELDCSIANEQNVVSEVIFLWEGDAKKTVKMFGRAFGAHSDNAEKPSKQLEESNSNTGGKNEVTGKAAYLPRPAYPRAARAVKAMGAVQVEVIINELGKVVLAKAVSGHPLLRTAAVKAAQESKFTQTRFEGMPIKIAGYVTYNFVP